jgi:hypothetical protein
MDGGSEILSPRGSHGGGSSYNPNASMLWGRSDMKEKFYSGSSQSNPWVRDLLWKRVIKEEKDKLDIQPLSNPVDSVPPHMRSVHAAQLKAERSQKIMQRKKKLAEQELEQQIARDIALGSARGRGGGGGGGGGGRATGRALNSRGLSTSRSTGRIRPSSSYSSYSTSSYGGGGGTGGGQKYAMKQSKSSASLRRGVPPRPRNPKLPALDFDALRSGRRRSGGSRASSRASSRRTDRSSYSQRSQRSKSGLGGSTVGDLATILRTQNEQLRRGLQQQVSGGKGVVGLFLTRKRAMADIFFFFYFFFKPHDRTKEVERWKTN